MFDAGQPRDFDEWRSLAKRDPEGFELARRRALDAVIAQAPESRRHRLRGLQWRVDRVRERSATPLAACISLSDMMWESFAGENGLIEALCGDHNSCRGKRNPHQRLVIPLHKELPE